MSKTTGSQILTGLLADINTDNAANSMNKFSGTKKRELFAQSFQT